MKEYKSVVC